MVAESVMKKKNPDEGECSTSSGFRGGKLT